MRLQSALGNELFRTIEAKSWPLTTLTAIVEATLGQQFSSVEL